jgi:hypothetical protein
VANVTVKYRSSLRRFWSFALFDDDQHPWEDLSAEGSAASRPLLFSREQDGAAGAVSFNSPEPYLYARKTRAPAPVAA